ncbi:MAG: hypothetical protein K8F60_05815 [Melioribacteraceae bacterium]|nr:hypothetical protein [Melioribacteraceae bacterium]
MNEVFSLINSKKLIQLIDLAEKEIVLIAPGITGEVSAALVSAAKIVGKENITVILDKDTNAVRYGYGEIEATETLVKNNIKVRSQDNIRIGIIITDLDRYIFNPTPQIIEAEPEDFRIPNAIRISEYEAHKLLNKINPPSSLFEQEDSAEIGKTEITNEVVKKAKEDLERKPAIKPDLARKMLVTSSAFQIVDSHLEGTKIERRTFRLNASDLGITDPEIRNRISASYKILDNVEFETLKEIDNIYQNICELYLIKVKKNDTVILYENRKRFDKAIESLKEVIKDSKEKLIKEISNELEKSKELIIPLIMNNLKNQSDIKLERLVLPEPLTEKTLWNYLKRKIDLRFPKAEQLLKEIKLKIRITNVSDQLINNEDFRSEIEKTFDQDFDEIVRTQSALGIKEEKLNINFDRINE